MDGLLDQVRTALHQVWRRRWIALGIAWGICLLGWTVVALIPSSFEARARLFVESQQLLPTALAAAPVDRQADLFRIRQALTSSASLEKVVRRTALNGIVESEADVASEVARLRENIKIGVTPDNLVEITASVSVRRFSNAENARLAASVVQTLLELLVEEDAVTGAASSRQALTFLDAQLKRRESELRQAEERRATFEQQFLGLLPGEGSVEQRMAAARTELASLDQQLVVAQASLSGLRGQMAGIPATMPGVGGGGGATSQLAALELQLAQAQARGWTSNHPDVVSTQAEIARLRPRAAAEPGASGIPNPALASLRALASEKEAQVAAAASRKAQLQASLNALSTRQTAEPGAVAEQARLNRDYEVLKRQYDKLLEDREQVRLRGAVASEGEQLRFRVVEGPAVPKVPASPPRPLLIPGILVFGLGAGIAAAFVLGQLQTSFATADRLAAVSGLPVLGTVGEVLTPAGRLRRGQQMKLFASAGGALAAAFLLLLGVELWQRSGLA